MISLSWLLDISEETSFKRKQYSPLWFLPQKESNPPCNYFQKKKGRICCLKWVEKEFLEPNILKNKKAEETFLLPFCTSKNYFPLFGYTFRAHLYRLQTFSSFSKKEKNSCHFHGNAVLWNRKNLAYFCTFDFSSCLLGKSQQNLIHLLCRSMATQTFPLGEK